MKTLNVMLSNLGGRVVPIGYEGENLYTRIRINCIEVFSEYPDATVSMVVSPPVGEMYPAVVEKSGVMVIWDITDSVLSSNGSGECQLTFTEGDVVRKSVVFGISINRSLVASGEAPEPVQEWIDRAEQTAQEIAENAAMLAKQDIVESYGEIAPAIIETASGAIASFSDGADGMLVKTLNVDIDPVQDLHGYDSPWPAGGGKNKLSPFVKGIKLDATDGAETSVNDAATTDFIPVDFNSGWALSGLSTTLFNFVAVYNASKEFLGRTGATSTATRNLTDSSFISGTPQGSGDIAYLRVTIYVNGAGSINEVDTMKAQLEQGSATSYAPYSNVCPISGWTEANVSRTGKNLCPTQTITKNGNTYYIGDGSTYTLFKAGTYVVKNSGTSSYMYWRKEGTSENNIVHANTNTGTFTLSEDCKIRFWFYSTDADTTFTDIQIEVGSSPSSYEPYSGSTAEYEFPQSAGTVYGGTLTIHQDGSGELVVDHADLDLGTLTWARQPNKSVFRTNDEIVGMKPTTSTTVEQNIICDTYKTETWVHVLDSTGYDYCICEGWGGKSYVAINDTRYNDYTAEQFKSAMSGVHLVYELATPVTYQLTNQQVLTLLKGNNVFFADCGAVSLEYPADTKLYIDRKVAELQALILENISNS